MKVTVKGQITIPLAIREHYGFYPGAEVKIVTRNGQAVIEKCDYNDQSDQINAWLDRFAGSATNKSMTTDEIMAMTRGED
ncbi:AbrB/MazE/SpoVT family DNA-binding domain-containing protein [Phragmitibacter flavus]|uniref:AbrB/MazE/SpoVT family DNA-binding domain-containing protein n=1 Tax=Phragmitibacter flavus TaxID=2576071 RepID=A0A5R8KCQ9_9BACT|nr:AbrB/MazE/SpoVT family DNA-binding domain-containing protein [Phragmitibacter flavus]TLD70073.1 AbrB/MazE/SpoVT family DNA-binding domain-containing protein [Phragmitibacter flavus]